MWVALTRVWRCVQGSGKDHTAILAWKKPDGACGDSPQHLIPRVMKFIRRGSAMVMSEGLAEELHNRWCATLHHHRSSHSPPLRAANYIQKAKLLCLSTARYVQY